MRSTSWRRAASLVVAAAEGTVERLHYSAGGGGITAYVRSPDGAWMYYYAHLDSYAPGLADGQRLHRGDPIGRVGSTGNANAAWPHLHFAVHRMSASDRWYQGLPVNPYPLLAGERALPLRLAPTSPISEHFHEDQRRGHSSRQHHRI